MVVFMLGSYSFMRINYLYMVVCITPYVLILFSLLGYGFRDVATERILDTAIGCVIALLLSYFLFPNWESEGIKDYMRDMIKANAAYLQKIIDALSGQQVGMLEYKLARKDVYVHSANLSAAFQRMISEPKSKQRSEKQAHQFVVLNHILFSNIASVTTMLLTKERKVYGKELILLAKRAHTRLLEGCKKLGDEKADMVASTEKMPGAEEPEYDRDELLLREQLQFINKLSIDIDKTAGTILQS
jgi:uncharacterized membrane protein YccC